jgi:hypothetical protein
MRNRWVDILIAVLIAGLAWAVLPAIAAAVVTVLVLLVLVGRF